MSEHPREPLTDSPWLWFTLFSAVGLSALLATGGRLGKRQAGIENKYQARAGVVSGDVRVEIDESGAQQVAQRPHYSTPEAPVIPLWPLQIVLAGIFAGSLTMLLRQQFAFKSPDAISADPKSRTDDSVHP